MSQRERMRQRQRQIVQNASENSLAERQFHPNIDLQIDELTVRGVRACDRDQLGNAVQGELTALLAAQGLSEHLRADAVFGHSPSQAVMFTTSTSPSQTGQRIAQSVYRSITQIPSAKRASPINATKVNSEGTIT
jgi:hypothetical protein